MAVRPTNRRYVAQEAILQDLPLLEDFAPNLRRLVLYPANSLQYEPPDIVRAKLEVWLTDHPARSLLVGEEFPDV